MFRLHRKSVFLFSSILLTLVGCQDATENDQAATAQQAAAQPKIIMASAARGQDKLLKRFSRLGVHQAGAQLAVAPKAGGPSAAFLNTDEDGDGVPDTVDEFPLDPTRSTYPTSKEVEPNDQASQGLQIASVPVAIKGNLASSSDIDSIVMPFNASQDIAYALVADGMADNNLDLLFTYNEEPATSFDVVYGLVSSLLHLNLGPNRNKAFFLVEAGEHVVVQITARPTVTTFPINYRVLAFVDSDGDTVPDDVETALGSDPLMLDTDDDSFVDSYELMGNNNRLRAVLDADQDGIPNVLESDSDNDTILDKVEGLEDADGDGLPNAYDIDSDGNGLPDSIEVGLDLAKPIDSDRDGSPDFKDLDDDADRLFDVNDSARLIPVADHQDTADYPMIISASSMFPNGTIALGAIIEGSTVRLTGTGFNTSGPNVIALFSKLGDGPGSDSSLQNIVAAASPDGKTLSFTAPSSSSAVRFLAVSSNEHFSNDIAINIRVAKTPLLITGTFVEVVAGSTISFQGRNITSDTVAYLDGTAIPTTFDSATKIKVVIPAGAASGVLTIRNTYGESNAVNAVVNKQAKVTVKLATTDTTSATALSVAWGVNGESSVASDFKSQIQARQAECQQVAVLKLGSDGTSRGYLLALYPPAESNVVANSLSTAVALSLVPFIGFSDYTLEDICSVIPAASADANIKALSDKIASQLFTSGSLESVLSGGLGQSAAMISALASGASLLKNLRATQQASVTSSRSAVPTDYLPNISPSDKVYGIQVSPILGNDGAVTGDIKIKNYNGFFASAKIVDSYSGRKLAYHVRSAFDPLVIGPQKGLTLDHPYGPETQDQYQQPQFHDSQVALVTPGLLPAEGTSSPEDGNVSRFLARRTFVNRVALPLIAAACGVSPKLIESLEIPIYYADITQAAMARFDQGDLGGAVRVFYEGLKDDFLSAGPISEMIVRQLNITIETLIKRFSPRFIPYIGEIILAVDFGPPIIDGAVTLHDISSTPASFKVSVVWPLRLLDLVRLIDVGAESVPEDLDTLNYWGTAVKGAGLVDLEDPNGNKIPMTVEFRMDEFSQSYDVYKSDGTLARFSSAKYPYPGMNLAFPMDMSFYEHAGHAATVWVSVGNKVSNTKTYIYHDYTATCQTPFYLMFGIGYTYESGVGGPYNFDPTRPLWEACSSGDYYFTNGG